MSKKQKKMLIRIIISFVLLAASVFIPDSNKYIRLVAALIPFIIIGWDILYKSFRNILHGQIFDENFLMALATVGALIIGETAVSAGIVSVPVLTMAAAATIATLAVPSLYEQSILFRFAVIVLAGCFGVPGLACAALTILAMACGSEPFGYDYLYPLMPPGRASVRDGFVRSIWSRLAKSGEVISRHEA